jgi:hypothetical protein
LFAINAKIIEYDYLTPLLETFILNYNIIRGIIGSNSVGCKKKISIIVNVFLIIKI